MNADDQAEAARSLAEEVRNLPALREAWELVELEADEPLFAKGDPGDAFYTLLEGEIDIVASAEDGRHILLERLGPGQHFGELSLVDGGARVAGAVARSKARLERLHRDDFLAALPSSPALTEMTFGMMSVRMRRSTEYLDHLTDWARMVATGEYEGARQAISTVAAAQDDANISRFVATFNEMVAGVEARETELAQTVEALRIEIDRKKHERQVAAITDSDFFRDLQANARDMRRSIRGGSED
jgi:CRP-like cAMP-binding protein